jgi:hypothetical protein
MILVVVSIGATVFAFATGGFSSIGNSFSSLLGTAGNQISEQVVIEQVVFVNTGVSSTSGANLYVRDIGVNAATIAAAYVQNVTAGTFVEQYTGSPLPISINSGSFQLIFVKNFIPDHGQVYSFTIATSLGNTVLINAKYY